MRHAVYAFLEVVGAALKELAHLVDFLPVPLAMLLVLHELPHVLRSPVSKPVCYCKQYAGARRCLEYTMRGEVHVSCACPLPHARSNFRLAFRRAGAAASH